MQEIFFFLISVSLFKKTTCFRNARLWVALLLMDSSLAPNNGIINKIKFETLSSGTLEAFLESAPQLIFQCSIIFRTGSTSKLLVNEKNVISHTQFDSSFNFLYKA
jgi:hypothetical protein